MPRAEREQLMLDVAGRVFAERGYHDASMDEIAEGADVTKPMLYAYFGSKQGLYAGYIERTGSLLLSRLVAAGERSQGKSAKIRLRTPIAEFLAFVEEHRDGWTVLYNEASASAPVAGEVAQQRSLISGAVARLLETEDSELIKDAIAHAVVGAGESIANWWLAHPEVDRDEVTDVFVRLVQATLRSK